MYSLITKKDGNIICTSSSEKSILVQSDHLKMITGDYVHIIRDGEGNEYER